ncbi:MAG: UbiA family prenyltransferase [Rhodocyclaceae bacterium]
MSGQPPLFVDLDGTLIKTDLLVESALALLKRQPWMLFAMIGWLLRGKAHLKAQIASRVTLESDSLPLHAQFVEYLQAEAASGREIWLATASDARLAQPVAERVGLFRGVIASDGERNMRGSEKLKAILEVGPVFDYAGNATADYPIWEKSRKAIVVNPDSGVEAGARTRGEVERVFENRPAALRAWIKEARVYQWLKNLLIGVPLLTSHAFTAQSFLTVSIAFLAFGLVASATYMFNDLLDLPSDRRHPRKCRRPFAAGDIGIASGIIVMTVLLTAGITAACWVSPNFLLVLLGYLVVTLSYSLYFKTYMLIDVLLLAGLYTLRIMAGAVAIAVPLSSWLLAFSMFVFLSLALVKRASELVAMEKLEREHAKGRDYGRSDLQTVISLGASAGYLSVLVLALYVDSPYVASHYSHPQLLWLLCPFMLYWISRLWMKTTRGQMHDDPIVFSLRDRGSWASFVAIAITVLVAM